MGQWTCPRPLKKSPQRIILSANEESYNRIIASITAIWKISFVTCGPQEKI